MQIFRLSPQVATPNIGAEPIGGTAIEIDCSFPPKKYQGYLGPAIFVTTKSPPKESFFIKSLFINFLYGRKCETKVRKLLVKLNAP